MKTYSAKPGEINKEWYVIDASGQVLGRLASEAAKIIRGKNKPQFTPHIDTGDYVIVINAEKIKITGRKREQKNYYRHSGYLGGLKTENLDKVLTEQPAEAIERAVKGMMPRNKLGRAMLKKLKVYSGSEHPHGAQSPKPLELGV